MATCPLRRTVSIGSLMKSSVAEVTNEEMEYDVGVITGSMEKFERRRRGVAWVIKGVMMLFRRVGMNRTGGQSREGSWERFCVSERFGERVGVKTSLSRC